MSYTVVLISGASRGLGRAIFERYIARPNHIVIAANRNPTDSNSQDLPGFKTGEGSKAILVKVDANVDTDAAEAVKKLETEHGIDHLDIVYANAGIATIVPKASAVTIEDLKAHMQANVYGLVTLLQATLPLLKKGTNPKWATMGSQSGYLTNFLFFPNAAYGPSKVAAHWLTRALHDEEPWLTSIVIDPGRVQTDLGNAGAVIAGKMFGIEGMDKAELEIPTSVNGFVKVVDDASHDTHSGKLWTWEGQAVAW